MGALREKREEAIEWDLHEQTEVIPLEFTDDLKPELYGLEASEVNGIVGGIDVIKHELEVLKNAYIDVIQLEITPENLSTFKDLRKNFTKNRTSAEKLRKAKKSYFLNGGRFVDAIFKNIDAERELMESKLLEAEKFFENQEKEKARLLNLERIEKIRPYVESVENLDFSDFDNESFDDYVLGKKTRFENEAKAKLEAEEKEAEDKRLNELAYERQMQIAPYAQFLNSDILLREMSDEDYKELFFNLQAAKIEFDKEQEKIRLENERLKRESEAKEKALEKERAEAKARQDAIEFKARQEREQAEKERQIEANKQAELQAQKDAEIKKEREAREKLEADLKAKQDAELKAEQESKKEAEKLAKAPIKKQLNVWVDNFVMGTPAGLNENQTVIDVLQKFEAFKKWAKSEIEKL